MLIPDYSTAKKPAAATFTQLSELPKYQELRTQTTDKIVCILFVADWDESSGILKNMMSEMPQAMSSIIFCWVDCD